MNINIRYPNITGLSEKEQLTQVKGYLYQLVNDLNYALSFVTDGGNGETDSTKPAGSTSYEGKAGEVQNSDLRALLAQELRNVENLIDQIETDLANGKFNGPQGIQGPKGDKGDPGVSVTHSWEGTVLTVTSASGTSSADLKGDKGDKGNTGEKGDPGQDYVLTEEDKAEIIEAVLGALAEKPNEEE